MRVGGLEQAPDRVAGARGGVQRRGRLAQAPWGAIVSAAVTVSRSLRPSCSTSATRERLQAPAEAAARAAHALGDRPDPAAVLGVEVQDAIGLAVAQRAQDHPLDLDLAGHDTVAILK